MRFYYRLALAFILSTRIIANAQDVGSDTAKAAKATEHATVKTAEETEHGTKKVVKQTAGATGHAARKTAHGIKKGAKGTARELKGDHGNPATGK